MNIIMLHTVSDKQNVQISLNVGKTILSLSKSCFDIYQKYPTTWKKVPLTYQSSRLGTFFNWKVLIFFLFLHKNICCGYLLDAPKWGASNEYPQHMFLWRNKNIMWLACLIWSSDIYRQRNKAQINHLGKAGWPGPFFWLLTELMDAAEYIDKLRMTMYPSLPCWNKAWGHFSSVANNILVTVYMTNEDLGADWADTQLIAQSQSAKHMYGLTWSSLTVSLPISNIK